MFGDISFRQAGPSSLRVVVLVAAGIPVTGLDFTGACIGPEGPAALAQRMPENLQTLSLDAAGLF